MQPAQHCLRDKESPQRKPEPAVASRLGDTASQPAGLWLYNAKERRQEAGRAQVREMRKGVTAPINARVSLRLGPLSAQLPQHLGGMSRWGCALSASYCGTHFSVCTAIAPSVDGVCGTSKVSLQAPGFIFQHRERGQGSDTSETLSY